MPPRWKRRKEVRPQEILEAALYLFVQKGFMATRMEEVARQAGVTPGTLYLYYSSKQLLLQAAVRESLGPMLQWADTVLNTAEGTGAELLERLYEGWYAQLGHGTLAGIPKLMVAEAVNFPELAQFWQDEVVVRVRELFLRALLHGQARGEFYVPHPDMAVRAVLAPLVQASLQVSAFGSTEDGALEPQVWLREALRLLIAGLKVFP